MCRPKGLEQLTHFTIKGGAKPSVTNAPPQQIAATEVPDSVALLGQDMLDMRPKYMVSEGDVVTCGQTLFSDRSHPEIAFVTPISGVVSQLSYGPRRTLSACIIYTEGQSPQSENAVVSDFNAAASARDVLLSRGMWPAFRTRPFGRIPTPKAVPEAIFVNAKTTSPLAPDPAVVLDGQLDAFCKGMSVLSALTEGIVYICQSQGVTLCPEMDRVQAVTFSGSPAAGLAGTHIDRLHPVSLDRQVWSIGYQDVAAIGHLFQTGRYHAERVVSIAGPAAPEPRLVQTVLGANIADISRNERACGLSGDPNSGCAAQFLGRFHDQITLVENEAPAKPSGWIARLFSAKGALVPTQGIERALAIDILPIPLMRALSVGDSEAAVRLGCLALIEEDVAALSRQCTSGADYGELLRHVLDDLMKEVA